MRSAPLKRLHRVLLPRASAVSRPVCLGGRYLLPSLEKLKQMAAASGTRYDRLLIVRSDLIFSDAAWPILSCRSPRADHTRPLIAC